ncbi:disulfide bond formation protein DsbA [Rhizobium sp. Leaf384]|uniref:DsbA family protein n=1 Tax=unclassified Rhizobium TaxID=2613769 RepID=UPI0007123052|nr:MULTISPECIES: DsbA family protein [unclassified Rhizobium]KQS74098.1 disulfide bond formation protein DsbA [Rhizobium sp. Leaf383]KQS80293.1 disulfide bond formation protein DsbA [Rhizobium sp. Leaf384]
MTISLRRLFAASLMLASTTVSFAPPAMALDDKQKAEFGAFIREYLVANPEVMLEVQEALKAKQAAAAQQVAESAISANKDAIFHSKYDVSLGNPQGDVTIVEFYDYNCGYCKRALPDMQAILDADKNVRFVLKELPILGQESLDAHRVSSAFRKLAPEKYGDFHKALLGGEERATEETAIAVAERLGVKEADIRAQMVDPSQDDEVRQAYTLANALGVTGTPSYVIGNEAIFGAVGADELASKIANMRRCGKTAC